MSVVKRAGKRSTPFESLGIAEVCGVSVLGHDRGGTEDTDGFGFVLVELQGAGQSRIECGDSGSNAQGRGDQAVGAGAGTSGGNRGATRAGTDRAAESAHAASGGILHNAGVDAENVGTRLGAQQVGGCDVQVIAGDVDVEIVLERKRDCVIDGEIDLAIAHECVDTR